MTPEVTDVQSTLTYGQSHDTARALFPVTLFGIALGLFLLIPFDGADVDRERRWLGVGFVLGSLALLAMILYRRSQPSMPSIVLSAQGVLFRDISEKIIPWHEIREVGVDHVRATNDLFSTKVTKLVMSKSFYTALTGGSWRVSYVGVEGDPSEIYLSYLHKLPFDEFQFAVRSRWHAFSRYAVGTPPPEIPLATAETAQPSRAPRAVAAVQRVRSFAPIAIFADLFQSSTRAQRLVMVVSTIGIMGIVSNLLGVWSTAAQDKGRASAAEWRVRQEKFDADRAATEADQRRIQKMWDSTFKCMDEYWKLHEQGQYKGDPECMKSKR